ncbi:MAG: glycosyl transferase family 2 [Subtercola sp.]|nr:glycosyl transferase family 2 [Subtercola sp.]
MVPLLLAQALEVAGLVRAHVLVVDNDPDASARAFIEGYATDAVPLVYAYEPQPGITAARNRALTACSGIDLLVFIDDDERPSASWLRALLDVQRESGCTAVAGPVVSVYEREPEAWITAGRYFERKQHATGAALEVAATNNLLLDLRQLRRFGLTFDLSLGISGGGDTLFTRQIVANGGRMLWSAEASVTDVVPRARVTRRWVVLRAFRSGNSWSVTSLMLAGGGTGKAAGTSRGTGPGPGTGLARALTRLELSARGGIRAAAGLAQIVAGMLMIDPAWRARGTRTLARGAGMLSGAWGYGYHEYRRR